MNYSASSTYPQSSAANSAPRRYYPAERTADVVTLIDARRTLGRGDTWRRAIDRERDAVLAFCAKHPEYERLGHDAVAQVLRTMRTPDEHEEEQIMRDEGVVRGARADWHLDSAEAE
jgi:hypothetical protein